MRKTRPKQVRVKLLWLEGVQADMRFTPKSRNSMHGALWTAASVEGRGGGEPCRGSCGFQVSQGRSCSHGVSFSLCYRGQGFQLQKGIVGKCRTVLEQLR